MWGATEKPLTKWGLKKFQLTHPMWGATRDCVCVVTPCGISTHTPHVGCDEEKMANVNKKGISTHTPHVGCDGKRTYGQMTIQNFNSHTPCGVRQA